MKKIICILASAALFGACEQRTEVAPAAPAAEKKESNTTIVNPPASTEKTKETTNTITTAPAADKKTESTTTTSTSPNP
jgi:PBP1b-binding outer membrane lipoprotein LpoB